MERLRGPILLSLVGIALIGSGLFAMLSAVMGSLLPHDVNYLGMTAKDLCGLHACRVVHFMQHDRVSFGGSIIAIGMLYVWTALRPLQRGEPWAWWMFAVSGAAGFASFLTYLSYGYLDVWHGWATLALFCVYVAGMAISRRQLRCRLEALRVAGRLGLLELRSRLGLGRALIVVTSIGLICAGATIMCLGMTTVFVPQDLEYMQLTVAELNALNPRLIPLIAHDRAGFGGGLCSGGLALLFVALYGIRPSDPTLWLTLCVAGSIGFLSAIGIHPLIGYDSLSHLAPAWVGALGFAIGAWLLYRPMAGADRGACRR